MSRSIECGALLSRTRGLFADRLSHFNFGFDDACLSPFEQNTSGSLRKRQKGSSIGGGAVNYCVLHTIQGPVHGPGNKFFI